MVRRSFLPVPVLVFVAMSAGLSPSGAQEAARHGHARVGRSHALVAATGAPVPYRGLTINRSPGTAPGDDEDIYQDGPVRYNDVRDFSPAPYTTSGVQFPFGLDGIGGYGSDLDVGAGQDAALYDRGAGSRP